MNPWKNKGKKTVYDNPWIKVVENDVVNPAGNDSIYGVVHFKNKAIAVVPLDDEMNTWLVGQYRYPIDSYEWEVVEGGGPENEQPLETAKRELKEEAGVVAKKWDLVLEMQLSNCATDEVSFTYVARDLEVGENSPDEDEMIDVKKIPFQDAVKMCLNGEIKDALSIASILRVKMMLDSGEL